MKNSFKLFSRFFVKIFLINIKLIRVIDNKSNKDIINEIELNLNISEVFILDNLLVLKKNFEFILIIITLKL